MAGNRAFTGVGLYVLRKGGKIELPEGLAEYVPWCRRGESYACLGQGSEHGCLTIFPPIYLEERERLLREVTAGGLEPADLGGSRVRLLRALAFSWPLTISQSGHLTVPMHARRMGLLPEKEGSEVALLAVGGAFELWHPDKLREEMQLAVGQLGELLETTGLQRGE